MPCRFRVCSTWPRAGLRLFALAFRVGLARQPSWHLTPWPTLPVPRPKENERVQATSHHPHGRDVARASALFGRSAGRYRLGPSARYGRCPALFGGRVSRQRAGYPPRSSAWVTSHPTSSKSTALAPRPRRCACGCRLRSHRPRAPPPQHRRLCGLTCSSGSDNSGAPKQDVDQFFVRQPRDPVGASLPSAGNRPQPPALDRRFPTRKKVHHPRAES